MKQDITFLIPSMHGGGAEKVVLLLSNELVRRGWVVTILISKCEGAYLNRLEKEIKIVELKYSNISKNIFEISKYLKTERPTIFYSSLTYVNVIVALSAKLARYKGKLFFSEHSNFSISNNNKSVVVQLVAILAKYTYRWADCVVCVSDGVMRDLVSQIPTIKQTAVIWNPIEKFKEATGSKDGKFRLISMGRLDRDKNFGLLIEAFNIVAKRSSIDIELNILGDGPDRESLFNRIAELGLHDKIFLLGFVHEPEKHLIASDLFVFTSNKEGFGNVLVEALSCGLPVISTDCPSGPAEILMEGKIGKLVGVNDREALIDAMLEAIENPDKYSTKDQRILRANDFSVEKTADKYELLFNDCLMKHPKSYK